MNTPIRFGLIGVGGIGSYHLAAIDALAKEGRAELCAVADPTVQRLPDLNAELNARGLPWHLDYREMLRSHPELDAVTIATPIPFHREMTLACLERGLFVHLEKPPVPLIQQLEELIAADAQEKVAVGFQWVTACATEEMKRLIVSGHLGEIRHIRAGCCWPRLDGYYGRAHWAGKMAVDGEPVFDGPATNALAHLIHNIMYFAATAPEAFAVPIEVTGEFYRVRPGIESYDVAALRGQFASGATFSAAFTHASEKAFPFQLEVEGSRETARISEDGGRVESSAGRVDCPEETVALLIKSTRHFLDVLHGTRPHAPTRLRDTRGYLLATNGALVSSGGIHQIDPQWRRVFERDGERGYEIPGLRDAVKASLQTGRLFSELDIRWAVPGAPIALTGFDHLDFARYAGG